MTEENQLEILTQISYGGGSNEHVPIPLFLEKYSELDDQNNAIIMIPKLEEFLSTLIPLQINSSNVKEIPTDTYESRNIKMEEELALLKKNKMDMQRKMKENQENFVSKMHMILEETKVRFEDERSELIEQHKSMIDNMEKLQQTKENTAKIKEDEIKQQEHFQHILQQKQDKWSGYIGQIDKSLESINEIRTKGEHKCIVM